MKQQDLRFPYKWEDRHPLLRDRVLFIPEYYDHHATFSLPKWEDPQFFGNRNPIHIEYCSGNGEWILKRAIDYPKYNWIAVEKQFKRIRKIFVKRHNQNISNLFIISGEAHTFTHHYLPHHSLQEAYINFPDPWPKERHAKHRLIQTSFIDALKRVLISKGHVNLVTDDRPYYEQMVEMFRESGTWDDLSKGMEEDYGSSYFERLWRSKGRNIYFLRFQKININT